MGHLLQLCRQGTHRRLTPWLTRQIHLKFISDRLIIESCYPKTVGNGDEKRENVEKASNQRIFRKSLHFPNRPSWRHEEFDTGLEFGAQLKLTVVVSKFHVEKLDLWSQRPKRVVALAWLYDLIKYFDKCFLTAKNTPGLISSKGEVNKFHHASASVQTASSGRRHCTRRGAGLVFTNILPRPLFYRRAFSTLSQLS